MIELAAQLQNTCHMQPDAFRLQQLMVGVGVRDHDRHPVSLLHVQRISDAFTQNHLLFTGLEAGPRVILHKGGQRAEPGFLLRVDPFHLDGAHIAAALHQAGEVNIGRRGDYPLHFLHLSQRLLPVIPRLVHGFDFTVRHHRQHAVIQLALKAVHRAEADDQHCHPQRNTDGGDHRDQRHHAAAPPAAAETQCNQ